MSAAGVILAGLTPFPVAFAVNRGACRFSRQRFTLRNLCFTWAGCAAGGCLAYLHPYQPAPICAKAANILLAALVWWFNKRRRDRARALMSEKWRYLRDVMVRTLRERTVPRPVAQPVPGGVS